MTLEERALKVRNDLFSRYDQLNALWQKAEEQIRKNHIPRPVSFQFASFPLRDDEPDGIDVYHHLGVQKVKGEWRICYAMFCELYDDNFDWKPITECAVEVRVSAAKHLPGLRQAAIESAETFIPDVESAIQQLSELTQ